MARINDVANTTKRRRSHRRGNAVTLLSSLVTLLGASAFVVDVGFLYASQTQLQAGLDAAALAGVGYFNDTDEGVAEAKEKAIEFALQNKVMGAGIVLADSDIEVGYVDVPDNGGDPTFVVAAADTDPGDIDAMRIRYTKTGIPTFFANLAFPNSDTTNAWAQSIAVQNASRGAGGVQCYLPIALPRCMVSSNSITDITIRANDATSDNFGWGTTNGGNYSAVGDALSGTGCTGETGDDVNLNNGMLGDGWNTIVSNIETGSGPHAGTWDSSLLGAFPGRDNTSKLAPNLRNTTNVIQGPIMLFDAPGACANGAPNENYQFSGSEPISGWSWGVVYDVVFEVGRPDVVGPDGTTGPPTMGRVRVDPVNTYEVRGTGGGDEDATIRVPGTGTLVY